MSSHDNVAPDTFWRIPSRVFLDTCVVNLMLDFSELLHNDVDIPRNLPAERQQDVEALCGICDTGVRALWCFTVSARTFRELKNTRLDERRHALLEWFAELWHYQSEFSSPRPLSRSSFQKARRSLTVLPDLADRNLLLDALRDGCQAFCTTDRRTILNRRNQLAGFPCRIITPSEWWSEIRPWAAVWL
jgi:hypothetical protein